MIDALFIFLIPFAVWWSIQTWRLKDPKAAMKMERGPVAWLSIIGLLLCIGAIVYTELKEPHHTEGYQRAIWKDGKLIRGEAK